jgi:pyruvate-formate lyase-activating enzyme
LGRESDETALSEIDLQRIVVEVVQWLGPIRICFRGETARSPRLVPMVRFANRLECPTHLITAGPLDPEQSLALLDAGLAAATVRLGALDDSEHLAQTGTVLPETMATLDNLRAAREERARTMILLAALGLTPHTVNALGGMAGLARQAGVDGVLVSLGVDAVAPPGALEAVNALAEHRTSRALMAALGGRSRRLRTALRVEVRVDGTLQTSPRVPCLGPWQHGTLQETWESADALVAETLALDRPADEIELVPEVLYSRR